MNISEFIYLFKATWNKYYADKHLAQKQLKYLKDYRKYFITTLDELRKIIRFVEFNMGVFPSMDEFHTENKARNFVKYLNSWLESNDNNYRYKKPILEVISIDVLENTLSYRYDNALRSYAKRDYADVQKCCEYVYEELKKLDKRYNVRFADVFGKFPMKDENENHEV